MADLAPKRDDDSQSGKAAKKNIISSDQANADEDVSSSPPERVHIFTKKPPPPSDSSKSDDEALQCSLFKTNRPMDSARPAVPAPVLNETRPPVIGLKRNLIRLMQRIATSKKAVYGAAMKAEDLEAIMQALQRTRNRILKKKK